MAKKKGKKGLYIGIAVGVIALGVGGWYFMKKRKEKKMMMSMPPPTTSGGGSSSSGGGSSYSSSGFPLKKGSGGSEVKALQKYLNSVGKYGLVVDGKFGSKTADALKRWNGKTSVSEGYYNSTIKQYA